MVRFEKWQEDAQGGAMRTLGQTLAAIAVETKALGFDMASDPAVGSLLRALAGSKPGGTCLELGTGTGLSTAWLLAGLSRDAKLVSVDNDMRFQEVARRYLDVDARVSFCAEDAGEFIEALEPAQFDLVFADTWVGKFSYLDKTLALLKPGGIYVVDDLLPQANWPAGHQSKVDAFVADMARREAIRVASLDWASGILIATRIG
jgi:predicted O-methyltransferase YrrM